MDFTRQPIIETIISAREGHKLVVRSSKSTGQEEYFVDAVEVVSFGSALFFRSLEKPKSFLVPATDYEVLEVREARMVLKNVALSRTIKIAGGKEKEVEPRMGKLEAAEKVVEEPVEKVGSGKAAALEDSRLLERRKRRQYKRRRGRLDVVEGEEVLSQEKEEAIILPPPEIGPRVRKENVESERGRQSVAPPDFAALQALLTPPPQLIRETIARYKDDDHFKNAFFEKAAEEDLVQREFREHERVAELLEEDENDEERGELEAPHLMQPEYGSFQQTEEDEEETYEMRKQLKEGSDESERDFFLFSEEEEGEKEADSEPVDE